MTERHEAAARLALLKVIGERIGDARKVAATEVTDTWRPKDRAAVVLPDGRDIGSVTLTAGRARASVVDDDAFFAWVEATHPDQMETVTTTRPNADFVERLISAAKKTGVPVDAETGEQVPGIEVTYGDPYPMVRLSGEAVAAVAEAWRRGDLAGLLSAVLPAAIESGTAE